MVDTILIISGQVVRDNSKINWPDLNYPDSGQTILRYLHKVNYDNLTIQLDGEDGPVFSCEKFPKNVGFYQKLVKTA
jgi:hypothetical protein